MADEEASKTLTQQSKDVDEDHPCKESGGISILEVLSVTYFGSSPVNPEDQIGSICMEINNTSYYLYHEDKVDKSKPSIRYGDQFPIENVGPICFFEKLKLKFDLFSREYKDTKLKVAAQSPEYGNWLAKPSVKSIDGYSHISVVLGCFPNATVANLKVVLQHDIPPHAKSNVHGFVIATNNKFDHPSYTSYLFSQNSVSTIQVGHNGVLPLSKSCLGVPLNSMLNVEISLFCDGLHYKGTASIIPKINDKSIHKVGDHIKVEVIWNWDEDSSSIDEDSCSADEDSCSADYLDLDATSECDNEDDIRIGDHAWDEN
ncbi:hypothetical protein POM88_032898 [Heracleum sosnowskyi]|uniref:Uncharacterized protein n=1 Tax=Heracleum sosnowskyi TaxID=360622 RepID=A0AAD8I347_9APIA|nr:hypothetical protein POM88_032898 [Heracleum sosnowskyi]